VESPRSSNNELRASIAWGQTRPVQVINFVAKGHHRGGMLSVLAFKTLAIGRNSRRRQRAARFARRLASQPFMKDVENVNGRMGDGEAVHTG